MITKQRVFVNLQGICWISIFSFPCLWDCIVVEYTLWGLLSCALDHICSSSFYFEALNHFTSSFSWAIDFVTPFLISFLFIFSSFAVGFVVNFDLGVSVKTSSCLVEELFFDMLVTSFSTLAPKEAGEQTSSFERFITGGAAEGSATLFLCFASCLLSRQLSALCNWKCVFRSLPFCECFPCLHAETLQV